ncbi:MAG: DUF4340 domain-containing protein [Clostridia bacterium]|nr:DUF4340 domain-containing protein [Clostridia bacterium]
MLKNLIIMLLVLAAVGGLTAGVIAINNNRASVKNNPLTVISQNPKECTGIVVKFSDREFEVYKNNDDRWTIRGFEERGVSHYKLADLCQSVSALAAEELLTETATESDLVAYGLAPPKTSITTEYKGKTITLELGADTPGGGLTYVKLAGNNKVYMVRQAKAWLMARPEIGYIAVPSPGYDPDEIVLARIAIRGRPVIELTDDPAAAALISENGRATAWKLTQPYEHDADATAVRDFFMSCLIIGPSDLIDDQVTGWEHYGLDDPWLTMTMKDVYDDGYTIEVSDEGPTANSRYCRLNGEEAVYSIYDYQVEQVEIDPRQLVDPFVALVAIKYVDEVRIEGRDSAVFRINREMIRNNYGEMEEVREYFLDGQPMQSMASTRFYQTVAGMTTGGETGTTLTATPVLTITFIRETRGLPEITLRYVPYETDKFAVCDETGYSKFYVRAEDIEELYDRLDMYRRGRLNTD